MRNVKEKTNSWYSWYAMQRILNNFFLDYCSTMEFRSEKFIGLGQASRLLSRLISFSFVDKRGGGITVQSSGSYHFNLSLAPAEKVDDFSTSPISSRQKLKLFIVHM